MNLTAKSMRATRETWSRVETRIAGPLAPPALHNMRIELLGAVIYGLFHATLQFIPALMRRMGASAEELAMYSGQGYIAMMLVGPLLYWLRPRQAKPFVVWCLLLSRSFFIWIAFVSDATWVLIITFGYMLLMHLQDPPYSRIVSALYPAATRARIISTVKIGMALTVLAANPLAGWLLDRYGYQWLFPLAAVAGMAAALVLLKWQITESQLAPKSAPSLSYIWRIPLQNRRFGLYLVAVIFFGMGGLIGSPLYPFIQVDRMRLSYTEIGFLGLCQSLSWVFGFFVWGRVMDRIGGPRCLVYCGIASALMPFTYLWATEGWMLIPAYMAAGLSNAGVDIGFLSTSIALAPPDKVSEYAATQSMLIGIRGLIASFMGVGLVRLGFSFELVFVLGAAFKLLSAVIFARVGKG